MSENFPLTIHRAIVHNLDKKTRERETTLRLRKDVLPISDALTRLVSAVHDAYEDRAGKSYGAFQADTVLYPAQTFIASLTGADDARFVSITGSLMELLANQAKKESFSTGGHVLMVEMSQRGKHWFLVTLLTDVAGAAIDANLNVVDTTHLDLAAMRFAGRVSITDWVAKAERYISFLRGKKADVSAYFQDFLGCSTVLKPLVETQRLVQVIKQFAVEQNLDQARRDQLLRETDDVARDCVKNGTPLDLESLSNRVWPDEPKLLQTAFAKSDPALQDGFIPDGRALIGLRKFTAKAQNWKLEFDREAMANQTISFDRVAGTLTIHQLPEDVKVKLAAEFRDDTDNEEESAA